MDRITNIYLNPDMKYMIFYTNNNVNTFTYDFSGKTFKHSEEDSENHENEKVQIYKFKYSGGDFMEYSNDIVLEGEMLYISDYNHFTFTWEITPNVKEEAIRIFNKLSRPYDARQTGREITSMRNLANETRPVPLPENTLSVISGFLTGERGSLEGQINKQKQKTGISLAAKARRGGKTRKANKLKQ